MTISTYLNFDGNCREAFEFYRSVFGGEFAIMETFRNGPSGHGNARRGAGQRNARVVPYRGRACSWGATCLDVRRAPQAWKQLLSQHQREPHARNPTTCSPSCPARGSVTCRCRTCSGARTSARAPTSSASAGRSTASTHRSSALGACINFVGGPNVGASLVGALSMMTNTGNHKGLPLHAHDRPNWYSIVRSLTLSAVSLRAMITEWPAMRVTPPLERSAVAQW